MGRSQPADWRASPTARTISGTTRMPKPGTPVFATPTPRAHTAQRIHRQGSRAGIGIVSATVSPGAAYVIREGGERVVTATRMPMGRVEPLWGGSRHEPIRERLARRKSDRAREHVR